MKLQIIFATGNEGKIREIREILAKIPSSVIGENGQISIASMREAGVECSPEEDGYTFEANAIIKAKAVADLLRLPHTPTWARERQILLENKDTMTDQELTEKLALVDIPKLTLPNVDPDAKLIVMSDDSGLVIDALKGEPGIQSARYLGRETTYTEKMNDILKRMEHVPERQRTARFVAAVAAVLPNGESFTVRGEMEGVIGHEIKGDHGFGYDPIFYLPELGVSSAEITEEEKNELSHRGRAIRLMIEKLAEIYPS